MVLNASKSQQLYFWSNPTRSYSSQTKSHELKLNLSAGYGYIHGSSASGTFFIPQISCIWRYSPQLLKPLVSFLAEPLALIFNESLVTGAIPLDWQIVILTPKRKICSKHELTNYKPVILTSIAGKSGMLLHLNRNSLHNDTQHWFMSKHQRSPIYFACSRIIYL